MCEDAEIVLMELGDGYHGDYGTKIIENTEITESIEVIIFVLMTYLEQLI